MKDIVLIGVVAIGAGCFIGSGVTTKKLITINKNSYIRAGSLVK